MKSLLAATLVLDPAEVIVRGVVTGDVINLSREENCNLYCFLQKVRFFDENGDIRGTGVVNHTLSESPELAKYSDVIITQVFQTIRSTKGIQDKCHKAVIYFHQYLTNIFTLALADSLQTYTDVRGKIVRAVNGHTSVPSDLETQVKEFLKLIDSVLKAIAKAPQTRPTTVATSELSQVKPTVV